jgi:hypothetical protein
MKYPSTNTQAPENTQTPNSNLECGGLTPLWISNWFSGTDVFGPSELKTLSSHRTPYGSPHPAHASDWSLVIGAYLVLGGRTLVHWCLALM